MAYWVKITPSTRVTQDWNRPIYVNINSILYIDWNAGNSTSTLYTETGGCNGIITDATPAEILGTA